MHEHPIHNTWISSSSVGCFGILEQVCLGNVLDMTKFEKQRAGRSYPAILSSLYSRGALRAHTLGLWPWGAGMYFTRGFAYGSARIALDPYTYTPVASSAMAGVIEGLCTAPWNMARVRIAEQQCGPALRPRPALPSLIDFPALLRTTPLFMAKRGLDWGVRSCINEPLQRSLPDTAHSHELGTFAAGMLSTVFTTPVDRLVPVLQQRDPPPLREWWRRQRWSGWMAGGWARALHGGWHTMFILGGLRWVRGDPREDQSAPL